MHTQNYNYLIHELATVISHISKLHFQGCMALKFSATENIAMPSSHMVVIIHHIIVGHICDPESKNRPYGAHNFRLTVRL